VGTTRRIPYCVERVALSLGASAGISQRGVSLNSAADLVLAAGPPLGEGRLTGLHAQKSLALPRPGQRILSYHKSISTRAQNYGQKDREGDLTI
jgi:hypothetical protein